MERAREVHVDLPRCPFCHDSVRGDQEKRGCPSCMAWHHEECWKEHGQRCATCGKVEPRSSGAEARAPAATDSAPVVRNLPPGGATLRELVVLAGMGALIGLGLEVALLRSQVGIGGPGAFVGMLIGVYGGELVVRAIRRRRRR